MATTVTMAAGTDAGDAPLDGRPGLIGTALLDARGDWEVVDEELCELLGRSEEQLLALPLPFVVNPDDLARERLRLEQLLAGGLLTYRSEARVLHSDGHAIWVLLDAAAIVDPGGAPRCLVQLQDISARKRLELSGTGWPLSADDLDRDGVMVAIKDPEGRHLRVNAAFERTFSVDGERLRGRSDEYLFPQAVAAGMRVRDGGALTAADPVEQDESVPLADGDRRLASVRFGLLGAAGRPYAICVVSAELHAREAVAAHAARLFERERRAREAAGETRSALLAAEAAERSRAGAARRRLLDRACGEGAVVQTSFPSEPADDERRRLAEAERSVRAELDALRAERDAAAEREAQRGREVEREREARAAVESALASLREDAASREAARREERTARAALEAERDGLRTQLEHRLQALEGERADRAEADAEVERLRRALAQRTRELDAERAPKPEIQAELEHLRREVLKRQEALESERAERAEVEAELERLRAAESAVGERVPLPALAPAAVDREADGALESWHAAGQARLTWALAEASAPYEGARAALAVVGETLGWAAGGCYSSDDASGVLRCCAFWQAPGATADELETVSWQSTFRPGSDLVGRVLERGRPEWVEDVATAKRLARSRAAAAGGLRSLVVVPIASRDETLGVIELFSAQRMGYDERMLEVLTTIGLQLGQFFMRSEAESLRSRYGVLHR